MTKLTSKKIKKEKPSIEKKEDDLLTLNSKKKQIETPKATELNTGFLSSVFSSLSNSSPAVKTEEKPVIKNTTPLEKITNGLEEKIIVNEIVPVIKKPIIETIPDTIVYEISYQNLKEEEQVVYTKDLPMIAANYQLVLVNAFGMSNLKELILGRREIKISCILPLESSNIVIDMRGGCFIKVVSEQEWMNREYNETKDLFDNAVLKAYREMAAQGITTAPAPTTQPNQPKQKQLPAANQTGEEYFPVGNIPVNRGIINF